MNVVLRLFVTLPWIIVSCFAFSQSSKPAVSNEPAWITKNNFDYTRKQLDKHATDSFVECVYERQVNLADQSQYYHRSKKIISNAGVQNGSEISVTYNPSYEQLIFHNIQIIRNGEKLNKLQLSKIKTLHQEKELSGFIYNGAFDAVLILEDVRMGDIIEYSYTLKGFNPIFKNKYTDEFNLEYSVPVYEMYYKLIVPQNRTINIKKLNTNIEPIISTKNNQQVYEWRRSEVAPLILQDYTPGWHDPYANILLSEYNSWKEVNDWAMELFPVKKVLTPAVQKKINEIKQAGKTDAERIAIALRFVQDDIRYMGIEMGVNSHKPADPSKVFAQRFGDCKEKSYLLCCMLSGMDIDARPVLINTVTKKNTADLLPAPTDFDHVTVRVSLNDKYYWFDPTIAYQRGNIDNIYYPDYQTGLVIGDNTTGLTTIEFKKVSKVHVKEYFKVANMFGEGTLKVTTEYKGNAADEERDEFNNQSQAEIMTNYQKFYAAYFEDIKADSVTYVDNDTTGIFTTTEYYTIPTFWKADKENVNKFSFSSFMIDNNLTRPKEKQRRMPFKLAFPAKYNEEILIDLPENWSVTDSKITLKNAGYSFSNKFYCVYNHVHLIAEYESNKDHITAEESAGYFKDLASYDESSGFQITSGAANKSSNPSSNTNPAIIPIVLVITGVVASIILRNRRRS